MEVVSWNLNGLEDADLDARTEAAMTEILLGPDPMAAFSTGRGPPLPDVVLLQEVVERSLVAHIRPHLEAAGYAIVPHQPPSRSYFEVAAVRGLRIASAQVLPFPRTGQWRTLLELQLESGERVLTAHLESLRPGRPVRLEQAAFVLDRLRSGAPAVFAGDTNLRVAEWKELDGGGVEDAWVQAGSVPSERATWAQMRFDRGWAVGMPAVTAFGRIGVEPVPGLGQTASDHRGIRFTLGRSPERGSSPRTR